VYNAVHEVKHHGILRSMPANSENSPERRALVVATFSRRMRVRLTDGSEADARIKGKRLRPVCGDRVAIEAIPNEPEWLITEIFGRDNELSRPNLRGKVEVLAANLDRLVVASRLPSSTTSPICRRPTRSTRFCGTTGGSLIRP
jgi:putative ribosome biogenesis GTPase RsgA